MIYRLAFFTHSKGSTIRQYFNVGRCECIHRIRFVLIHSYEISKTIVTSKLSHTHGQNTRPNQTKEEEEYEEKKVENRNERKRQETEKKKKKETIGTKKPFILSLSI